MQVIDDEAEGVYISLHIGTIARLAPAFLLGGKKTEALYERLLQAPDRAVLRLERGRQGMAGVFKHPPRAKQACQADVCKVDMDPFRTLFDDDVTWLQCPVGQGLLLAGVAMYVVQGSCHLRCYRVDRIFFEPAGMKLKVLFKEQTSSPS
jgi:hypothetical protein